MAKVTTEKLVELLRRSHLAESDRIDKALAEATAPSGALPAEPEPLADALIAGGLISQWQAEKLLEGRHKGFFLGKYKLQGHLGTGGMSSVYLAENTKLRRLCAIKVLPQSRVEDSSYLERFYLEAKAAAALAHPNIVTAYDIDNQDNIHYFVMEYVEGRDLQTTVKQDGPLDFDLAAEYIAQTADALAYAHEAGLIHRDIKPANLLVDGKGQVKMLDLGLALFRDDAQPSLTIAHDENVLGTADYLAPEQAVNSHTVDARADIYSLGCTLYFLLTGHPPFPDGTLTQRLLAHQREVPPSIYKDRRDAPRDLVEICNKMMAKQVDRRVQTAAEVRQMLNDFMVKRGRKAAAGSGSSPTLVASASAASARSAPPPRRSAPVRPSRPDDSSALGSSIGSSIGKDGLGSSISAGDTVSDRGRGTSKLGGKPAEKKLVVARSLNDPDPAESLGEFVFDLGPPRGGSSSVAKGGSISRTRKKEKNPNAVPMWIWAVSAIGLLTVIGVLIAMLNR
jgi:serine/threonine-protein kinase